MLFRQFTYASLLFIALFSAGFGQTKPATEAPPAPAAKSPPADPHVTYSSVHVNGPYVAMTFDDGPSEKLTPRLLDLLASRHIKVTFFVIGENVAEHPEIVARAAREGHEIANHSWSHPNFNKMSDDAVRSQLRRTDDAIKNAIGKRPIYLRPPYGNVTAHQKRWIHDEFGYEIVLWDVDPLDWKRPGPTVVTNRIVREARPGSIILSHDIHPGTIEAMPAMFDQLEAKGFKFVTVSELIAMATPETPKPAKAAATSPAGSPPARPPQTTSTSAPAATPIPATSPHD